MRYSNRSPLPVQFVDASPEPIREKAKDLWAILQDEYFSVPVWAWGIIGYLFLRRR